MNYDSLAHVLYIILSNGGFTTGGFNFDAKLRRQSIDLEDLFYGHIGGVDYHRARFLIAADMIEADAFKRLSTSVIALAEGLG